MQTVRNRYNKKGDISSRSTKLIEKKIFFKVYIFIARKNRLDAMSVSETVRTSQNRSEQEYLSSLDEEEQIIQRNEGNRRENDTW